ncbi:MAG: MATE family efflux transporter [Lachnospiraceae bacterium]|nr:MATE family efflux transporter [Lachnospiraceae bacterium]
MNIQLSDHFTYTKLIQFVLPSIGMMIFTSIYGVVDGLFISNFVGKTAFAAVNLIIPFTMVLGAIGFMLGTGGNALVAKTLGEGKRELANQIFSFLVIVSIVSGTFVAIVGITFMEPVALLLGADEAMLRDCVIYGRILMAATPAFMLQIMFQSFLITAEKPGMGFWVTVVAGITNMVLDALLVAGLKWGVTGAALATGLSQCVGGIVPLIYFTRKNDSLLQITKTKFMWDALWKTCSNGISEFLSNISMSLVSMLYNLQLLKFAGENGVAAYGVIMYVQFIFIAIFIGYNIGTAPIIGYNYGAQNHKEMQNIFKKSMILTVSAGLALMVSAFVLAAPLAKVFVGYDAELFEMTKRGFEFYAVSFFLCGFNIFGSSFFTALSNGPVSAVISFLRTIVFQVAAVLVLPVFFGIDGVWASISVAELLALAVTGFFLVKLRSRYHYV